MDEEGPFELAEPDASATLESLRSLGYSPESAIADLIDNSISAGARTVTIHAFWAGRDSYLRIADDGNGMTEAELRDAMRPSSKSPLDARNEKDLGRFGMGLKTASFSQARRLSVASKRKSSKIATRCWDLDFVARSHGWRLLTTLGPKSTERAATADLDQGTVVLWEKLDRFVGDVDVDDSQAHRRFLDALETIERHLAMVFQRLMVGTPNLRIELQGNQILPWDPFLQDEPATQRLGTEVWPFQGTDVLVDPFVLPHHDKLSPERFKAGGGPRNWTQMQGFYVYRNRRLVIAGDWLATFQREVHYQLARIRVDIDSQHDAQWQLDVMKASAKPPAALRGNFRRIATVTRNRASEVHRYRGKAIARRTSEPFAFVWRQHLKNGLISYRIEREHPLVSAALSDATAPRKLLVALLSLVEETVPTPMIAMDAAERPTEHAAPFATRPTTEVKLVLDEIYAVLVKKGMSHSRALERLAAMEPFQNFPELIATLGG